MNNSLSFYVQRYMVSYMIGQKGYGKNTISSYRYTFKLLLLFLKSSGFKKTKIAITDIDRDCVLSFMRWLENERKNSPATRNVRLAHLKSFFSYVMDTSPEYAFHSERILKIDIANTEKHPPVYLTENAVEYILHGIDSASKDGIRHLAILTLLYDSGCRVQELIDLKVSDIQFDKGRRIYVRGKGNKYREIMILPETEDILKNYIKSFQRGSSDYLFDNRSGNQLTRQGVRYILRKYSDRLKETHPAEYEPKSHPHLFRHSKATHLVNAGVNIFNVRDFLGHNSLESTQIYLTSNPEVTRKAIKHAASKTVPDSTDFFSPDEKDDLLNFLDTFA